MVDFYIVCYDVISDRRRRRLYTLIKSHTRNGQRSAYEALLTAGESRRLERQLIQAIHPSTDKIGVLKIDKTRPIKSLGPRQPCCLPVFFYLG